jgi:ribonuclease HI
MKHPPDYNIYEMEILDKEDSFYRILILSDKKQCEISYSPEFKEIRFLDDAELSNDLKNNIYQLRKILRNKRPDTFYIGFKLKFIFKNNADAIAFNDLSKLVLLDRREGEYLVESIEKHDNQILKLYTDGCFLEKHKKGAFAVLIEKINGLLDLLTEPVNETSSSLIELIAVIEGIKKVKSVNSLRIISDSRYVIKGLTEWMFNWKLNDWHTAQGEKVKNIEYWQEFDQLTIGKYIEFEWVKGHSFHQENTLCDFYAKQAAIRS